jgi:RNA polymerase sigma-70 factor, ECF subfamily
MVDVATPGLERALEQHRAQLTSHCYRMLGSKFEAEDAVQETMVRAWRASDGFEGRAALRTWLYRIATNVCIDVQQSRRRRALPMDLVSACPDDAAVSRRLPEQCWLQPMTDGRTAPTDDPAELVALREAIRDAFVAVIEHLPPRQRAVLVLREVLRWKAIEVAELLDASVAAVNSMLQRARAAFSEADLAAGDSLRLEDHGQQAQLSRYIDAFERADVEGLVSLLHEEATKSTGPGRDNR